MDGTGGGGGRRSDRWRGGGGCSWWLAVVVAALGLAREAAADPGGGQWFAVRPPAGVDPDARVPGAEPHVVERIRWPIGRWTLVRAPGGLGGIAPGAFVAEVEGMERGQPSFATGDLLVGVPRGLGRAVAASLARGIGGVAVDPFGAARRSGVLRVRTACRSSGEVEALVAEVATLPWVRFVEPDRVFTGRGSFEPTDPGFAAAWGLDNHGQTGGVPDVDVDAPRAWDVTTGDREVLVCVLDTGVQLDHPDLDPGPAVDLTDDPGARGGGPVNACDRHGTAVAGCVAARIDGGGDAVGVAPGCRVASARTFVSLQPCDGAWTSQTSWTVDALAWAQSIGARVTNNSNWYGITSPAIDAAYAAARDAGIVHFASSGNFGARGVTYPASLASVNAIGAVDASGGRPAFSNHGAELFLAGPGVDVFTTDLTRFAGFAIGDEAVLSGTSFASAFAAGAAALLVSSRPAWSPDEIEAALAGGAKDLGPPGHDGDFGWGLVSADLVPLDDPLAYCAPKVSADGCAAASTWGGSPSASGARPFVVGAAGVPSGRSGLLFYGLAPADVPFQGGTLCVRGPVTRTLIQGSRGDPRAPCSGAFTFDFGAHLAAGVDPALAPGVAVFAQHWYRDPGAGAPFPTALSDAVRFRIAP